MTEASTELPPPLVMQHRGQSLDAYTTIDEIHAWGTGLVAVRHGANFPVQSILSPAVESGFLAGALVGDSRAATLLHKSEHTIVSHRRRTLNLLGVPSARAAIRQLFDPLVGGLEVIDPVELDNEPSSKLVEFMEILAMGNAYQKDRAATSLRWSRDTFTKELTQLQTELGVPNPVGVLFWGFASNILGQNSALLRLPCEGPQARAYSLDGPTLAIQPWLPPPRPQTFPEMGARHARGFSITHPEARRGDATLHFPHDVQAPLDAALIFKGHNLHIGRISGVELLGGRVRIDRSHELLSKLTESDLRHLGAGCLGFNGKQSAATFYEAGDGSQQLINLQDALKVPRHKSRLRQAVDRAFQVGLLDVEKPLTVDLAAMPDYFPAVVRYAGHGTQQELAQAQGWGKQSARYAIDGSCAQLQVANRAAIVTVGHLGRML